MKKSLLLKYISIIFITLFVVTFSACDDDLHQHVYNQKVATEDFISTYATCTQKAKYYYSCECGAKENITFEYGEILEHNYGDWVSNNNGTHTKVCKNNCSNLITENCDNLLVLNNNERACSKCYVESQLPNINPAQPVTHTHEFCIKEIKQEYLCAPAKCNSKALYFYSCICGEKGTKTFEFGYMLDHEEVWETKEQPTCAKPGLKISKCTLCGTQINEEPIIALEHKFLNGKCSVCGDLKGTEGLKYKLNYTNDGYELVGIGSATELDIIVPKLYNGLPVKTISQNAFKGTKIVSVILSENLIDIKNGAFFSCAELTNINIPNSVVSIGDSAFSACKKLNSITFGKNVKFVGASAFYSCTELKNVSLNDNIEYVGRYAFDNCQNLKYNVKNQIKYLGNEQNKYLCAITVENKDLTNITIDNNCKIIASMAFQNCKQVELVLIPKNVKVICDSAFSYCSGLTSIEFELPKNWYIKSKFDDAGALLDVTSKDANPTYLTKKYLSYIFYKK